MTEYDTHHENLTVWPPAVASPPPSLQASLPSRSVLVGRNALWWAAAGLVLWVVLVAVLLLINKFNPSLEGAVIDKAIRVSYFASLFCEMIGVYFGWRGKNTRIGKVGLAVSLLLLSSMITLTLIDHYHYQSSSGQWFWNETLNDDCGCDGSG